MTFFKTEYTKLGIPKTWLRPRKSFEGKLSSNGGAQGGFRFLLEKRNLQVVSNLWRTKQTNNP